MYKSALDFLMQQDAWHALDRLATLVENLHALGGSFEKTMAGSIASARAKLLVYGNLKEFYAIITENTDPATMFKTIKQLPATGKEGANVALMYLAIQMQRADIIKWLLETGIYKNKDKVAESTYYLSKHEFENQNVEFFYDYPETKKRDTWGGGKTLKEILIEQTNSDPSNEIYHMFQTLVEPAWV